MNNYGCGDTMADGGKCEYDCLCDVCTQKLAERMEKAETALTEAAEALKPFAEEAKEYVPHASGKIRPFIKGRRGEEDEPSKFTIGDLRRASAWLKKYPPTGTG